jgi:RNA polymerase sigma factor (sigma-70 family)
MCGGEFEDKVVDRVSNEYIRNLVNTVLPADQREVIQRIYWMDQKATEVAAAMGCSVGWVSNLTRRAKDRLKSVMSLDNQGPDR